MTVMLLHQFEYYYNYYKETLFSDKNPPLYVHQKSHKMFRNFVCCLEASPEPFLHLEINCKDS